MYLLKITRPLTVQDTFISDYKQNFTKLWMSTYKNSAVTTAGPAVCSQRRQSNKALFWSLKFSFIIRIICKTAVGRKSHVCRDNVWSGDVSNAVGKGFQLISAHYYNQLKKHNNVITISYCSYRALSIIKSQQSVQ